MKKGFLVSVFMLFLNHLATSQSIDLVQHLSGPFQSMPADVAITDTGEMIFVGAISQTIDFDPGPGEFILNGQGGLFSKSPYIFKYGGEGNLLWARKWDSQVDNSDFKALVTIFSN